MSSITYALWAFCAGALIPLMAILNAGLARGAGGRGSGNPFAVWNWFHRDLAIRGGNRDTATRASRAGSGRAITLCGRSDSRFLHSVHHISCAALWCRKCDFIRRHSAAAHIRRYRSFCTGRGYRAPADDSKSDRAPGCHCRCGDYAGQRSHLTSCTLMSADTATWVESLAACRQFADKPSEKRVYCELYWPNGCSDRRRREILRR